MIQIIDNIIDNDEQLWLVDQIPSIPFFYKDAHVHDNDLPWFGHYTVDNGVANSSLSDVTIDIGNRVLHSVGLKPLRYEQIRINMTTQQYTQSCSTKHIDSVGDCNITMLYYIDNSDGDTVFYDNDIEIKRVSPVRGRAAIFDSNIYHNSYLPILHKCRTIINYNVRV